MRALPSNEELAELLPGEGSITWRRTADARTLLAAGYALLLQVAHPTVAAGVAQHSAFRQDPWGRLLRTLDLTSALVYAEPEVAAQVAAGLRARHRQIRGVRADGRRYSALDPDAYAWVWATLFSSIVAAHERFGQPLGRGERERFWEEWRRLGRVLGVRERDLPEAMGGYEDYFRATVAEVLEDNASVHEVLASIAGPPPPPLPGYARPAWLLVRLPSARALRLATVGLAPVALRERLGLSWGLDQELQLRALGTAFRAATPLMPRQLRAFGPAYLRWRRESIERALA